MVILVLYFVFMCERSENALSNMQGVEKGNTNLVGFCENIGNNVGFLVGCSAN